MSFDEYSALDIITSVLALSLQKGRESFDIEI